MVQQILVCDDEPHVVRAISLKFTRSGFDVKGASDVESCWRLLNHHELPALLIVDDSMPPGPGGTELIRRIRSDVRFNDLPIIMLTAKAFEMSEEVELLTTLDVAQIIAKPFSPRVLLANVCRMLGHEAVLQTSSYGREFDRQTVTA